MMMTRSDDSASNPPPPPAAAAPGPDRAPEPVPVAAPAGAEAFRGRTLRGRFFGAVCTSLQPILLSAIALPATAYVIRRLGPTQYGQWAVATTLVTVVTFLTNLGLRGAFVRSVAREPEAAARLFAEQLGLR